MNSSLSEMSKTHLSHQKAYFFNIENTNFDKNVEW